MNVIGYQGGQRVKPSRVARVLKIPVQSPEYEAFIQACENPTIFQNRTNEAKMVPPTDSEKRRWYYVPVRRCPSCLDCTSSQCTQCFHCGAKFLCRPSASTGSSQAQKSKAKAKARPPVFSTSAASSSSGEPSAPAMGAFTLKLPKCEGIEWICLEYKKELYVKPEKRQGDKELGTGVPATFLHFSSKACGNFVTLNATYTYNMGNKIREWTGQIWPSSKMGCLGMSPVLSFLNKGKPEKACH